MAEFRKVSPEELEANKAPKEAEVVAVDYGVVDELEPQEVDKPVQVEDPTVVFFPQKDFEGRVNDQKYSARKGVPVRVPRDVANIWLEDESRGYVRD